MATSNHTGEVEQIRHSMQRIRRELNTDFDQVRKSASQLTSWQHYVKRYPWISMGVAAAVGCLVVPRHKQIVRQIDADQLNKMIASLKPQPESKEDEIEDAEKTGYVKGALTFVVGMALRAAATHVVNNYVNPRLSPRGTSKSQESYSTPASEAPIRTSSNPYENGST